MQHGCPAKPLLKLKKEWKEQNYILSEVLVKLELRERERDLLSLDRQ